jgi:hypothetical protein
MTVCEKPVDEEVVELDGRLTRYWLEHPLTAKKLTEIDEQVKKILDRLFVTSNPDKRES